MTDARFTGLAREMLDTATGVLEVAGTARETLVTAPSTILFSVISRESLISGSVTTKALAFGVARETLFSETKGRFGGLARESLVSAPGVLEVSGLARETLVTAPSTLYAGGVAREILRTGTVNTTLLAAGLVRESLIGTAVTFTPPPFLCFIE